MPAFGWAARGREVTARTRSIASSIATGPTLQLMPITSMFHSERRAAKASGSEPSRQLPSSSIVTCATMGIFASTFRQAMPRQAEAVRAESIGFDNLGAGLHIIVVDASDQLRVRQVQLITAAV